MRKVLCALLGVAMAAAILLPVPAKARPETVTLTVNGDLDETLARLDDYGDREVVLVLEEDVSCSREYWSAAPEKLTVRGQGNTILLNGSVTPGCPVVLDDVALTPVAGDACLYGQGRGVTAVNAVLGSTGARLDVYGGGENGVSVTRSTAEVSLVKCEVYGDVFGGGQGSDVGGRGTDVTVMGGVIHGSVYGGGRGEDGLGEVAGRSRVTVGGRVEGYIHGGGLNASVGSVLMELLDGCQAEGAVGGGRSLGPRADVNGDVRMEMDEGAVLGCVYGGGWATAKDHERASAKVRGQTILHLAGGFTGEAPVIHGGGFAENDGSGRWANANVEISTQVTVAAGARADKAAVHGGGRAMKLSGEANVAGNASASVYTAVSSLTGGGHAEGMDTRATAAGTFAVVGEGGSAGRIAAGGTGSAAGDGSVSGRMAVSVETVSAEVIAAPGSVAVTAGDVSVEGVFLENGVISINEKALTSEFLKGFAFYDWEEPERAVAVAAEGYDPESGLTLHWELADLEGQRVRLIHALAGGAMAELYSGEVDSGISAAGVRTTGDFLVVKP